MSLENLMTFGDDLETFRTKARQAIMDHYVAIALRDLRPPTQRAMDTYKVGEAKTVLAGGTSSLLERESAMRGCTALQLARMVMGETTALESIELSRIEDSLAIDRATTHSEILAVLAAKAVRMQ